MKHSQLLLLLVVSLPLPLFADDQEGRGYKYSGAITDWSLFYADGGSSKSGGGSTEYELCRKLYGKEWSKAPAQLTLQPAPWSALAGRYIEKMKASLGNPSATLAAEPDPAQRVALLNSYYQTLHKFIMEYGNEAKDYQHKLRECFAVRCLTSLNSDGEAGAEYAPKGQQMMMMMGMGGMGGMGAMGGMGGMGGGMGGMGMTSGMGMGTGMQMSNPMSNMMSAMMAGDLKCKAVGPETQDFGPCKRLANVFDGGLMASQLFQTSQQATMQFQQLSAQKDVLTAQGQDPTLHLKKLRESVQTAQTLAMAKASVDFLKSGSLAAATATIPDSKKLISLCTDQSVVNYFGGPFTTELEKHYSRNLDTLIRSFYEKIADTPVATSVATATAGLSPAGAAPVDSASAQSSSVVANATSQQHTELTKEQLDVAKGGGSAERVVAFGTKPVIVPKGGTAPEGLVKIGPETSAGAQKYGTQAQADAAQLKRDAIQKRFGAHTSASSTPSSTTAVASKAPSSEKSVPSQIGVTGAKDPVSPQQTVVSETPKPALNAPSSTTVAALPATNREVSSPVTSAAPAVPVSEKLQALRSAGAEVKAVRAEKAVAVEKVNSLNKEVDSSKELVRSAQEEQGKANAVLHNGKSTIEEKNIAAVRLDAAKVVEAKAQVQVDQKITERKELGKVIDAANEREKTLVTPAAVKIQAVARGSIERHKIAPANTAAEGAIQKEVQTRSIASIDEKMAADQRLKGAQTKYQQADASVKAAGESWIKGDPQAKTQVDAAVKAKAAAGQELRTAENGLNAIQGRENTKIAADRAAAEVQRAEMDARAAREAQAAADKRAAETAAQAKAAADEAAKAKAALEQKTFAQRLGFGKEITQGRQAALTTAEQAKVAADQAALDAKLAADQAALAAKAAAEKVAQSQSASAQAVQNARIAAENAKMATGTVSLPQQEVSVRPNPPQGAQKVFTSQDDYADSYKRSEVPATAPKGSKESPW